MLEKNSDSKVHVEKIEQRPTASIAFGLERIGLIAVQAPILSCIILVGLIIGAIFGIERIKIDDSLSQLFRSNSREYRQYESETKRFPATEFDVLVVVEGKTLLARDNLEKLRDFVTDLQLVVLSLEPEVVASNKLTKTIGDIRKLMAEDLAGTGLNVELSGVPVMQL